MDGERSGIKCSDIFGQAFTQNAGFVRRITMNWCSGSRVSSIMYKWKWANGSNEIRRWVPKVNRSEKRLETDKSASRKKLSALKSRFFFDGNCSDSMYGMLMVMSFYATQSKRPTKLFYTRRMLGICVRALYIVCVEAIRLRGNDGNDGNDRGAQAKCLVGIFSV